MNDEATTPNGPDTKPSEGSIATEEQVTAEIGATIQHPTTMAEDVAEPATAPVAVDAALEELREMITHHPVEHTPEPAEAVAVEAAIEEPQAVSEPAMPVAEPAPIQTSAPVATGPLSGDRSEDEMLFERAMAGLENPAEAGETSYKKLNKGDRIEATVIQVERDRVFVDLGGKSEGVVPLGELTEENLETAEGHVKAGDKIQVVVLRAEGAEGNPIVSKKRAEFEEAWVRIVESFSEGKSLTAQVIDRVKGGLVVDIGVRGFVPATHVGNGKLRNIEKYVGESIPLKIIEIDRDRKKVVLSNRLAEEERREQVRSEIFTKVAPGDILEGSVRRLTDYGAFVDLGGIDGLLHISEMSWMRINHPREVLKEGEKIKVMVLRLDAGTAKISLGLRQVLPDPWNLIRENYKIGQKLQCKISRLVQSGAFVKLPEGAEAFLPISEISTRRINKPSDVLEEGQDVELTIIDLRPDERRMVLSLRGGAAPEYRESHGGGGGYGGGSGSGGGYDDDDMRGKKGPKKGGKKGPRGGGGGRPGGRGGDDDEFESPIVGRVPTGGATIGERLGMLKGFLGRTEDDDDDLGGDDAEIVAETAEATVEAKAEAVSEAVPEAVPEATPEATAEVTTEPTEEPTEG